MNVPTIETIRKSHMMRNIAMMLCCVLLCSVCLLGTSNVAYCEETTEPASDLNSATADIQGAVESFTEAIYTTMRKIITPIVIVVFGFAGFQFLLGGNQGTEKARKATIGGIAGIALVMFAPLIGRAIATAFMGSGEGSLGDYNPL